VYDLALWVQVDNPQGYGPVQRKEARYFRTREVGDYGIFFGVYGTGYVGAVEGKPDGFLGFEAKKDTAPNLGAVS
jgi:hypothetical protein